MSGRSRLVLAAMIFAVSMMFIDQTIVAIAAPDLQKDLGLSETGVQWIINGYLLSLAALFAFGGRLADIAGHRTMVILGVIIFATASALCGATPTGSAAETWLIVFRVIQGAGAAIMFPAALAIVIDAFPIETRGKALAAFFGITGGLTAVGPLAGGYLTEITWRAIFWVNIPVALIALFLTWRAQPSNEKRPAPMDYRGLVLTAGGMGLSVLALQQSTNWGWDSAATILCLAAGLILIGLFIRHSLNDENPLLRVRFFVSRALRGGQRRPLPADDGLRPGLASSRAPTRRSRSTTAPPRRACSCSSSSAASPSPPSGAVASSTPRVRARR